MNYRIEVTDNALAEAGEIYFWINEDSPEVAWRWYDGLMAAFKSPSAFSNLLIMSYRKPR